MGVATGDHRGGGVRIRRADCPMLPRMILGMRLREHRKACKITQEDAARAIAVSDTKIRQLESGQGAVELRDVVDLCDAYQIDDHAERVSLLGLAREANVPPWWEPYGNVISPSFEPYLGLEQTARVIRGYDAQFVPELLRTREYAHRRLLVSTASAEDRERRLALLSDRQEILHQKDPPHVWLVIDEAALLRRTREKAIMYRQLQHLLDLCDMPRLTLQIVRSSRRAHAAHRSFTLLGLPEPGLPDVVYVAQLTTGLYLDIRREVDIYRHIFNLLVTRDAASKKYTPAILRELIRRL